MDDQRWIRNLVRFGLPAVVLVFYITAAAHFHYTPDDSYVLLQFAKNILRGDGFAFSGGVETYGFTSPLWLLLVSFGGWLGVDLYIAAKGLDLVLACLTLFAVYRLALTLTREHLLALISTLMFSVNIWFVRWAGSGMETSLAVLLIVTAMTFALRNEYFPAIVLAALFTLVRPEGVLFAALVLIDVFINSAAKSRAWKMIAALSLVYLVALLPWLIFAQTAFGTIIPNTLLAKSGAILSWSNAGETFIEVAGRTAMADGVAWLFALVGVVILFVRRKEYAPAFSGDIKAEEIPHLVSNAEWLRFHFLPLAWIVSLPLLYVLFQSQVASRDLLIVSPVLIATAVGVLSRVAVVLRKERLRFVFLFVFCGIVIAQNSLPYHIFVRPGLTAFSQGMDETLIEIGKWLKANTPEDAIIMTPDVGAIAYYSDRRICDAAGLVSPEIIPYLRAGMTLDDLILAKTYRNVCNASYIVHRAYKPNAISTADVEPLFMKPAVWLALSDDRPTFYTVYKVTNTEH